MEATRAFLKVLKNKVCRSSSKIQYLPVLPQDSVSSCSSRNQRYQAIFFVQLIEPCTPLVGFVDVNLQCAKILDLMKGELLLDHVVMSLVFWMAWKQLLALYCTVRHWTSIQAKNCKALSLNWNYSVLLMKVPIAMPLSPQGGK